MAIDQRAGKKIDKTFRRDEAPATRVDPYPYIGIVKNNFDPTKTGRLQVWIPDLGGNQDDPMNWRTVRHISPFMGTTNVRKKTTGGVNPNNSYTTVAHTYGMWMVPPDIGVEVVCIFIAGNPTRGYWMGCVNSGLSRHMLPAMGSSFAVDDTFSSEDVKTAHKTTQYPVPVAEFNENKSTSVQNVAAQSKPIHEDQYRILLNQGLDRDTIRGLVSSSSQREAPSNVFGISTPGRPLNDPADNPDAFIQKIEQGKLTEQDYSIATRKGGHSFVMDDGANDGSNQLLRLRTANGHQIMMHDTGNTIYISHGDGTSWVELTAEGAINIFSQSGFNMRTSGTLNLHADGNINMQAGGKINMKSNAGYQLDAPTINLLATASITQQTRTLNSKASDINLDATSKISILAQSDIRLNGAKIYQNSGGGITVNSIKAISVKQHTDVALNNMLYVQKPGSIKSIVSVAPTHEPFNRGSALISSAAETISSGGITPGEYKSSYDATKNVSGTTFKSPANEEDLRTQPEANCEVGNLTKDQVTAYYAQIGKSESGGRYTVVNSIGFVGKYQFGYPALIDLGYVSSSCKRNSQLRTNPNVWTGKNGIKSLDDFLNNPEVQEQAMCQYTRMNYSTLCRIGAVTKDMAPEEVAGMLAVSHLLGAGGAKKWRNGAGGADAYGTTGDTYFQKGKYSVAVLAPKMATLDQPKTA